MRDRDGLRPAMSARSQHGLPELRERCLRKERDPVHATRDPFDVSALSHADQGGIGASRAPSLNGCEQAAGSKVPSEAMSM